MDGLITGNIATSAIMALIASFITEGVKRILAEPYYKFIPLPLGAVCVGIGVLLAWLSGADMVAGGLEGIVAAAIAAYGYDTVKGFVANK